MGVYSSSDVAVVRAQMREIASIGVQTVIVSWWGPESTEAARLPLVARAARAAGLRVALHVEPFAGRTPAALVPQLRAFASAGVTDAYVYDSTESADSEWKAANKQLAGLRLFANTNLPGKAEAGGFAGLYTYDVRIYDGTSFPRMCASAHMHNLLCAPSVGPGFDAERATGDTRVRGRANGKTYDRMWRGAIRAAADVVTITSYNEWHEGTQIEPASAVGAPVLVLRRGLRPRRPRRRACVPRPHGGVGAHLSGEGRPLGGSRRALVERCREPAAIGAHERVVGVEALEQRHRNLAQPVALLGRGCRDRADDELERALGVAGVEGGDDIRELTGGAKLLDQRVGAGRGEKLVEERVDGSARPRPGELGHDPAVPERLHRRNAADGEPLREPLVGVDIDLDERDLTCPRSTAASSTGASAWHGPHHSAQKSTSTGPSADRPMTSVSNVSSVTSTPSRSPRDDDISRAAGDQRRLDMLAGDAGERAVVGVDLDRSPLLELQGSRSLGRPDLEQLRGRQDPAAPGLAPRDPLELAQLLQRSIRMFESDPMQRGIERSSTSVTRRKPSPRSDSVVGQAQMRAPVAASRSSSLSFACVAWMMVVRSREATRVGEELDRAAAVLLEALLDLAWLLVGMDVEWELFVPCVGADLLEPGAGAGADGVGGDTDGGSRRAERLDLLEVRPECGLAHSIEPAALVRDMEQHDRDPGFACRLGRCKRLCGAEVVELSHRRVSGGAHFTIDVRVAIPDGIRGGVIGFLEIPSRHVQKSVPAARPRKARWKA